MEYLFYRLWQLLIGKSEEDMPPFGSMMIFSMLILFNIITIELLLRHFFDFTYAPRGKNEIIPIFLHTKHCDYSTSIKSFSN